MSLPRMHAVVLVLEAWALVSIVGSAPISAQVTVGEHHPLRIETPHPYPSASVAGDVVWRHRIAHPGATYIAVHFERFELAPGDALVISSPDDPHEFRFEGRGVLDLGRFWSTHVYGAEAVLELRSSGAGSGFGFVVDKYSAGFVSPAELQGHGGAEAICGTDDKDHVACWKDSEPLAYDRARSVAALLSHWDEMDPGLDRFCTGALVSCGSLLLTNNHCVPGVEIAANTTYEFMAEATECSDPNPPEGIGGGATDPPYPGVRFTGGVQLATDVALDYSLIQVNGDPHLEFGSLGMEDRTPIVDERIYIPQHPEGRGKQFGMESSHSSDPSGFCEVFSLNEPGCTGPQNDVGYFCDTDGGSSGSPVIAYQEHRMIALHHCARCPNRGVPISPILADIQAKVGSLPPPMPGEVPHWESEHLTLRKVSGGTTLQLEWSGAAEAQWYNVYRGTLAALPQTGYDHSADPLDGKGACDLTLLVHDDPDDLAFGVGSFYYLVSGENPCGEGPTGYDSDNVRRPDGAGCP